MSDLIDRLLGEGRRFSYFQAIRILRRELGTRQPDLRIRTRANLSLAFPDTDIEEISRRPDDGGYLVTANFFGLYGVSSPLPTFYTEDLLGEQREGRHAERDFLDIIHGSLYPLLFDAWRKYRLQLRSVEEKDPGALAPAYAFVGFDRRATSLSKTASAAMLRYLALFSARTRTALGLRTLLTDAFSPAVVSIEGCVLQWRKIPAGQRLRLGGRTGGLGNDAYLGSRIEDSENGLEIRLSELPQELFLDLLPGMSGARTLQFYVRHYLKRPLDVVLALEPKADEVEPLQLGMYEWSRLGLNTWLLPLGECKSARPKARVRFRLGSTIPAFTD